MLGRSAISASLPSAITRLRPLTKGVDMPIHVAITRYVKIGREYQFQQALHDFFQHSFEQEGVLGALMLTPAPGSGSREFVILTAFTDEKARDAFFQSSMF